MGRYRYNPCPGPCCRARGVLWGTNDADQLWRIDPATLTPTLVGSLGVNFQFSGLAWDPAGEVLYAIGGRPSPNLYAVDRATGAAALIGAHGIADLFGLAYDLLSGVLYASQLVAGDDHLYSLDVADGSATLIGTLDNALGAGGLCYDSLGDRLLGRYDLGNDLYEIDRGDASTTLLKDGPASFDDVFYDQDGGLAFDADRNRVWVSSALAGPGHSGIGYFDPAAAWAFTGLGALAVGRLTGLEYAPRP